MRRTGSRPPELLGPNEPENPAKRQPFTSNLFIFLHYGSRRLPRHSSKPPRSWIDFYQPIDLINVSVIYTTVFDAGTRHIFPTGAPGDSYEGRAPDTRLAPTLSSNEGKFERWKFHN